MSNRTGATEHLPPLADIIGELKETSPESWWPGPTFRSPDQQRHCVLSHIAEMYGMEGMNEFEEAYSTSYYIGAQINDKPSDAYPQTHPKDRCIAYLENMLQGKELTTHESLDEFFKDYESETN